MRIRGVVEKIHLENTVLNHRLSLCVQEERALHSKALSIISKGRFMLSLCHLWLFGKVNHQVSWTFYIKVNQCNIKADKEQNISDRGVQIQLHKFRAGTAWTERSQNLKFASFILISPASPLWGVFVLLQFIVFATQYWGFCSGFSPGWRFSVGNLTCFS